MSFVWNTAESLLLEASEPASGHHSLETGNTFTDDTASGNAVAVQPPLLDSASSSRSTVASTNARTTCIFSPNKHCNAKAKTTSSKANTSFVNISKTATTTLGADMRDLGPPAYVGSVMQSNVGNISSQNVGNVISQNNVANAVTQSNVVNIVTTQISLENSIYNDNKSQIHNEDMTNEAIPNHFFSSVEATEERQTASGNDNPMNCPYIVSASECYTDLSGNNVSVASNVTIASENVVNVSDCQFASNVTISSDNVNVTDSQSFHSMGDDISSCQIKGKYHQRNVERRNARDNLTSMGNRTHNNNVDVVQQASIEDSDFDVENDDDNNEDYDDEEDCEPIDVCGDVEDDDFSGDDCDDAMTRATPIPQIPQSYSNNNTADICYDDGTDAEYKQLSRGNISNNTGFSTSALNNTNSNTTATSMVVPRGRGRPRGSRGAGRGRGRGYLPPAVAEGLARHEAVQQKVYKMKYKQMKSIARSLVLENAALCDTVAEVQQKIILANEERRFLLRRLHAVTQTSLHAKDNPFLKLDANAWSLLDGRSTLSDGTTATGYSNSPSVCCGATNSGGNMRDGGNSNGDVTGGDGGGGGLVEGMMERSAGQPPVKRSRAQQNGRSSGGSRGSSKSKRLCPPITLDSAGRPIFPISLGPLTIHSLGEIVCERPSYHRSHVIFPVGFCSSRTYASVVNPTQPATYTCKILDAGHAPRFEIVCEEPETGEERVFEGSSPSDCHHLVLDAISAARDMPRGVLSYSPESNNISDRGLRFFGLSHPSVQNVLQACPGARKCHAYQWIKFEVCRSELEVEKVLDGERDTALCHETLLRNIRFASQAM